MPPCIRHRPFGMAGVRQGWPDRVFASCQLVPRHREELGTDKLTNVVRQLCQWFVEPFGKLLGEGFIHFHTLENRLVTYWTNGGAPNIEQSGVNYAVNVRTVPS